jgi:predicted alpha-1,6-mannanase (GH76 family)
MNAHADAKAAVAALMDFYDRDTGLWEPARPWWQSGNALQALLDYMLRTGSTEYLWVLDNTVRIQRTAYMQGEFRGDSTDDTAWWALAMLRAYDLTGEGQYVEIARTGEAFIREYWDDACGGGVWWDVPQRTYKNAISNELHVKLLAGLHNRITGDTDYLDRALEAWRWFQQSGMINDEHLVNDGLERCRNNGGETWTYNQGVILGALTELAMATGEAPRESELLLTARRIATATITSPRLSPHGILTEPSEDPANGYDPSNEDNPSFKGIFVRNLDELDRALPGRPYRGYLQRQARSAATFGRNDTNQYGLHWSGPFDRADVARQGSAVDLLTAVLDP